MDGRARRVGVIVLAGIGGAGWLATIVSTVAKGPGGGAISAGVTMLVLGVGAVLAGRPWWALITSRTAGAALIVGGVVIALIGVALLPTAPAATFEYFDSPTNSGPASLDPTVAARVR